MRYQTAVIMQSFQDGKSKPIQPTDILLFADEAKQIKETPKREITKEQSDRLNAAHEQYINRK